MPQEVKETLYKLNGEVNGNNVDGYTSVDDTSSLDASINSHKYNSNSFSHNNEGASVIDVNQENPGFWRSLYQNQYRGWGYTAFIKNNSNANPILARATVDVRSLGINVNISTGGAGWSPFSSTVTIANDQTNYSTREYAQAHFNQVRLQNVTNIHFRFGVESFLNFSNVGSSTIRTSVNYFA